MLFEKNHIYHIYNQGNNKQKIFFNRENYLFFLQKMNEFLLPYCDILAWCLMPNHFHWMVYVRETEIDVTTREGVFYKDALSNSPPDDLPSREGVSHRDTLSIKQNMRTLNNSIGYLIRSYSQAVNKQMHFSGSLFRKETKADCVTNPQEISPSYYNLGFGTRIRLHDPEKEYPQACFNYIHQNPVKAGLVKHAEDWEFSSFRDVCGLRGGKLINRERIKEFELT